ncbi:MAG: N-acetylglucosamine-1-phosphate uridyltransferase / Glucosamine-1-phosphate N-acetyltransferase [uncultured Thermoleophilia bacterium]|uniref:Bifunctional protein GlmU n=1 Tax=uncultured Thermoleophilia bacterium TaxID=1497501 RepID=A0A6J4UKK2_9ACTN|nr:MAG: N-acetylglucosamine-1-phosphate uridyltransferase / Glucosamine-1-phosphate N-acetyltransferase [uncultured Thermoleophilia bacterium]
MAGGKGTRMRSARTKVLHPVCGRPILGWVLEAARQAGASPLIVVTPPEAEEVRALLGADAIPVVQPEARGTGHAVQCGLAALPAAFDGDVLVVSGDTPLIRSEVLREIVDTHRAEHAAATLLSVLVPGPNAYGRVMRDATGAVARVVEVRDATPDELATTEINAGFYAFDAAGLRAALDRVTPDNDQGELYLPDVLPLLRADGTVVACLTDDDVSTVGVNTRVDLAEAARLLQLRLLEEHMLRGAGIVDPATTYVEHGVALEPDCVIHPFSVLRGTTRVETGAEVGPHAVLHDAVVGAGATAGPFVYLRPGAELRSGSKAGTYVEIKNAVLGEAAKVPHLSYIGDADIGEGTNIGAGTITANYDGRRKHRTTIGARVRSSSDVVFVAPVTVGDDAVTGAGSIITKDVPPGALGIARARQTNIEDYAARRRDDD